MATPWLPIIRLYVRDPWARLLFGTSGVLVALSFVALFFFLPTGTDVPLHYNVYFGIDFIGNPMQLYWLPLSALVLTAMNVVLAISIWRRDRILSYVLAAGALVVTVLLGNRRRTYSSL